MDYEIVRKIWEGGWWDNFNNNPFLLGIFHQDTLNTRIDEELELVKRPVLLQTGHLIEPWVIEEDDDF